MMLQSYGHWMRYHELSVYRNLCVLYIGVGWLWGRGGVHLEWRLKALDDAPHHQQPIGADVQAAVGPVDALHQCAVHIQGQPLCGHTQCHPVPLAVRQHPHRKPGRGTSELCKDVCFYTKGLQLQSWRNPALHFLLI